MNRKIRDIIKKLPFIFRIDLAKLPIVLLFFLIFGIFFTIFEVLPIYLYEKLFYEKSEIEFNKNNLYSDHIVPNLKYSILNEFSCSQGYESYMEYSCNGKNTILRIKM